MRAFEIHTFQNGKWKIDSVFDDRELAMFEAQRMESGRRYSGIRVVEEVFDESSQQSTSRTIFSGTKLDQAAPKAKPKAKADSGTSAGKNTRGSRSPRKKWNPKKVEKKKKISIGFLIMILTLSVFTGIGAIVGLRFLSGSI